MFPFWLKNPVSYTPPGGECLPDAQDMIMSGLFEIVETQRSHNVAIVCHAGTLKIITSTCLGIDWSGIYRLAEDYGCVNIIDMYEDNNAFIKLLNYTIEI